jgi:hypothetical protein
VIVGGESGFLQANGLGIGEHAKGAADFHAERGDATNHFQNFVEFPALRSFAPGSTHAETSNAPGDGIASYANDVLWIEKTLALDVSVVVGALRTVGAIFRTAAGFNGDELAGLHPIGGVILAVYRLSAKNQIGKWGVVNGIDFGPSPIVFQQVRYDIVRR